MRRSCFMCSIAGMAIGLGCEMQPMQKIRPSRSRVGVTQVESAQREVDRTLEQYRRDRESAGRDALQGSNE